MRADPALRSIGAKLDHGERITRSDALALFQTRDLLTLWCVP